MADKKISIADITSKLFNILEPLETDDRNKAIAAVQTLLGDTAGTKTPLANIPPGSGGKVNEKTFFDQKDPHNKVEELVVAARFRELYQGAHEHNKNDLGKVIGAARRNFDSNNFSRDLSNAKTKGLFNIGKENTVSYYGQQYVDMLPDREKLKTLRRPKKSRRKVRKKATKSK